MMPSSTGTPDPDLLDRFRAGQRLALARAISLVENLRPGFEAFLHEIHPLLGRAQRIGITGPPGSGKSTLTGHLAQLYREREDRVGIVAVDPTSPYTGGALLGDRIRMTNISTDPGVFIRSMATRGSLGGLATTSKEVADLLDAFGFDRVITETVGVGQSELEIAETADTTVVVLVPESGDSIQAMKAGLMEIADIFVINKADRPGADRLAQELEIMLDMRLGEAQPAAGGHHGVSLRSVGRTARERSKAAAEEAGDWSVPVLKTVAPRGDGLMELLSTLDRHAVHLEESGELARRRRRRFEERTRAAVERQLRLAVWREGHGEKILADALPRLASGEESPYSVAAQIVRALGAETSGEER